MSNRTIAPAIAVALAAILTPAAPTAAALACNDVEVVFARGTREPPGIGSVGQAFVDALRNRIGNRSMVIDVITSVPFPVVGFTNPLPAPVADRVAAVAVFGNPSSKIGLPLTSSPLYGGKAIDLCNPGDPVCSDGNDVPAHRSYAPDGLTGQAAAFVAGLL